MGKPTFEIYQSRDNNYRWRLKDGNGEIVGASEAYVRRENARRGALNIRSTAPGADIEDI